MILSSFIQLPFDHYVLISCIIYIFLNTMLQVIVNERGEESINWNSPLKIHNMIISRNAIIIRLTNVNNLSAVKKNMHLNLKITSNNQLHPAIIRVWSYKDLRFLYWTFKAKWLVQVNIIVCHVSIALYNSCSRCDHIL